MKIDRISLEGFGRLTNQSFKFGSGFNLIFGSNETGKSTLQRAIATLLYGFYSSGRINTTERAMSELFRPWDETVLYAGTIEYTLQNRQSFRVTRTFGKRSTTSVHSLPDGIDITNSFRRESQGRVFFAEEHTGMAKEVFENTSYIRQAELVALNSSANAITDTLMRLSASAASDNTATGAIALLQNILKTQVGTARARTKPLVKTRNKLLELEAERNQHLQNRQELQSRLIEINKAKEEVSQLTAEIEKIRYLETLASRTELQQKINTVQKAVQAVEESSAETNKWAAWADFPVHLRDEILKLSDRFHTLHTDCESASAEADEATTKLRELTEDMARTQETIETLKEVQHASSEELANLRKLSNQWEMARQATQDAQQHWQDEQAALTASNQQLDDKRSQFEAIVKLGYAGLAQLKQEWLHWREHLRKAEVSLAEAEAVWEKTGMSEAEFQVLTEKAQNLKTVVRATSRSSRKGCNPLVSNRHTQPPSEPVHPEVQIFRDLEPLYSALITARDTIKTTQESLDASVARSCHMVGVPRRVSLDESFFDDQNQILAQLQEMEAAQSQQTKLVKELEVRLAETRKKETLAQENLSAKVKELGLNVHDLQHAVNTYSQMFENKAALERAEVKLANLQLQVEAQEQKIEQQRKKQIQLDNISAELMTVLAQAEIDRQIKDVSSVEAALAEFERRFANHNQWISAQQQLDLAEKDLQNLDNLANLETSLAALDSQLTQMRNTQSQFSRLRTSESLSFYATQREQLKTTLNNAENRVRDLESANTFNTHLRHLAEIDEEIRQVKNQLQRLEWYGARLEEAQEQITEATTEFQKQFAPKLENLMGGSLNQITRGRYPNIHVDPTNLAVTVTAPEISRPVDVETLSTGTRELVYLMLRVSVAQLMSHSGEQLPLLLDDPLVQSDRDRQEQTLAYLGQLAKEMQIFMFTKDDWVKDWFYAHFLDVESHKSHMLS